jgi:hypothetical protein
VTGGDTISTDAQCMLEKSAEFDLGIAQHVRIRRATGLVFLEKVSEDALLVFGSEIHHFDVDADHVGNADYIDQVLPRRAILVAVVVLPVLHEQAEHVPALLLEQQGRDRRIDPTGQADDHCLCLFHAIAFASVQYSGPRHGCSVR